MTLEEQVNRAKGLYRIRFHAGKREVVAEMSQRCYIEAFYRDFSHEELPVDYKTNAIEREIKESFINYGLSLAHSRREDLGTLLHYADTLYFLDAHGESVDGQWHLYHGADKRNEQQTNMSSHLHNLVRDEGIEAALLISCNPQRSLLETPIPALYPTRVSNLDNFKENSLLALPHGYDRQKENIGDVLDLVDAVYELRKESHYENVGGKDKAIQLLVQSYDKVCSRRKDEIKRQAEHAKLFDPRNVGTFEGVTFTTSHDLNYSILEGRIHSKKDSMAHGLKAALIGGLDEKTKIDLDAYMVENNKVILPFLESPNYGLCLFIGYDAQTDKTPSIPHTITSPIIAAKRDGEDESVEFV